MKLGAGWCALVTRSHRTRINFIQESQAPPPPRCSAARRVARASGLPSRPARRRHARPPEVRGELARLEENPRTPGATEKAGERKTAGELEGGVCL
uniref:Uncharacterized protein n=1 Tax=Arundo donax TaxID=35708 RepID=A0A0A9GB24_ARUDO